MTHDNDFPDAPQSVEPGPEDTPIFEQKPDRFVPRSPRAMIEPDLPPPPPRRSTKAKSPFISGLNGIFSFILISTLFAFAAIYFIKQRLVAPGPLQNAVEIVVPPRSGMTDISSLLKQQGIIDEPLTFQAGVFLNGARGKMKAGEYRFEDHASMQNIIQTLRDGKSILHPVSIPEGLTSQQIVQRLLNYDVLTGQIETIPPEGTLLPETYNVMRGTSRQRILDNMAAAQKELLAELMPRKKAGAPFNSSNEMVTLASIVEKETGKTEERPHVASVFINRLTKGMRLQSDPTVIYGIVGGKGPLGRPLTRADLSAVTPYNTYIIPKLPPTPIANPGRMALEAVIAPLDTQDLYFVADGTGGHAFAATLEQHNANVNKWRQIERARGTEPQPVSTTPPALAEPDASTTPDTSSDSAQPPLRKTP